MHVTNFACVTECLSVVVTMRIRRISNLYPSGGGPREWAETGVDGAATLYANHAVEGASSNPSTALLFYLLLTVTYRFFP